MTDLFALLVVLSLLALIVGLIRPSLVVFWSSEKTRSKVIAGTLAVAVISFIGVGVTGTPTSSSGTQPGSDSPAAPARTWKDFRPNDQLQFLSIVEAYGQQYSDAPNELKRSSIAKQRDKALGDATDRGRISGWIGTLERMGTNGDGDAYISIEVGSKAAVKTWNNAVSDVGSRTLIKNGSELYGRIAELNEGMPVVFSGRLLDEGSVTESGGMTDPEFIFRFDDVSPFTSPQ